MQKLKGISDKNPFKVPENYFEEVTEKIISAASSDAREVRKTRLYERFKPVLLIAASITVVLFLSYFIIKTISPGNTNSELSGIINQENNQSYINDLDVIMLEENAASLVFNEEVPDVNMNDIIDYLLSENIEINDIYEQF